MYLRRKCQTGKTAILVIDMHAPSNGSSSHQHKLSKWFHGQVNHRERVTSRICKTIKLGKELGMETFVITYQGQAPHPQILAAAGNPVPIDKQEHDAFMCTDLMAKLNEKNVKNVIVCGYHRGACVLSTAKGADIRGLKVIVANALMLGKEGYSYAMQEFSKIADVILTQFGLNRRIQKLSTSSTE